MAYRQRQSHGGSGRLSLRLNGSEPAEMDIRVESIMADDVAPFTSICDVTLRFTTTDKKAVASLFDALRRSTEQQVRQSL